MAYVTSGDPDLATTREIVFESIRAGASIIELGVPFSDPVAEVLSSNEQASAPSNIKRPSTRC